MESLDTKEVIKKIIDMEKEIAKLSLVVKGLRTKITVMRSNLTSLEGKVSMFHRNGGR